MPQFEQPEFEMSATQVAAIRRIYESPEYTTGLEPLLRHMKDSIVARLATSEGADVYRAQGEFARMKIILDLLRKIAIVRS